VISGSWHHPRVTPTNQTSPASPTTPRVPAAGPALAPVPAAEPTHPCARCGAPVGPGIGLCERCNPLGLGDSASSQVHGTVFGVVAIAIVVMLVFARLSISGGGPYPATVSAPTATATGLAVTVTVTNEGTQTGQTTCRLVDANDRGTSDSAFVLSPRIDAGETLSFPAAFSELGTEPRELTVTCRTP
jgi:hypothetical protein